MTATTRDDDGFTLLELLTVILIIGVLTALAIPQFLSQQRKGFLTSMRSDLHNAVTAEFAFNANNGSFTVDPSELESEGYRVTGGVTPVHVKLVGPSFVACVKHSAVPTWLVYDGSSGSVSDSPDDCV